MSECPIMEMDFYGEWSCDLADYETCSQCIKVHIKECREYLKKLKKEKDNE